MTTKLIKLLISFFLVNAAFIYSQESDKIYKKPEVHQFKLPISKSN